MGKKKSFAPKEAEVRTFRLVNRSQNDECYDEDTSTPLVLEPYATPNVARRAGKEGVDLLTIPEGLHKIGAEAFAPEAREAFPEPIRIKLKPKAAAAKDEPQIDEDDDEDEDEDELAALDEDCYFPKDGYDYEKHLKRVSRPGKGGVGVILEAPSKLAEDIGAPALPEFKETKEDQLLAVRRDLQDAQTQEEKDILRALDFADEYEEADDDWLDDIVGAGPAVPEDTMVWGPTAQEHRQMPDLDAFKAMYAKRLEPAEDDESDEEGEEREHVGHAGEAIDDDDFQKFLANEYGDEDIGECEEEEIVGHVELENCEEVLDEYIQGRREEEEKLRSIFEPQEAHFKRGDRLDDVPRTIDETKGLIEKFYFDGEHTDEEEEEEVDDSEDRLWDCETVLSTLSNLSNRPGKIGRIKIAGPKKTEARAGGAKPLGSLTEGDEEKAERAAAKAESSEDDIVELPDVITTRDRDETAEEKKARKAGVKEMRRICRKMKKESKETYASEAAKLPGRTGGGDVRQKLRVTKL